MKIIALSGPANCGKTQTLNVVYHLLLNKGYSQVLGYFNDFDSYNFIGEKAHGIQDFSDILTADGRTIGITTGHDDDSLSSFLRASENEGCEVVICACSDTDMWLSIIKGYKQHTIIQKTSQSEVSLKRINDNEFAKKIVALI